MWRYASTLMVCGTSLAKSKPYRGFIKYQQPSVWRRLGQTRATRNMRDNIASKIGEHCQESMHYSRSNLLGLYTRMVNDEASAVDVTAGLGLELEELMYLTGSKKANKKLQKIYDDARELQVAAGGREEAEFFKLPVTAGGRQKNPASRPAGTKLKTPGFFSEAEMSGKEAVSSETTEITETTAPVSSDRKQRTLDFGFDSIQDIETKSGKIESEVPSEVPSELPVEVPSEVPAEMPSEVPVEVPSEVPAEVPAEELQEENLPLDPVSSEESAESKGEPKKPEQKTQKTLFDF